MDDSSQVLKINHTLYTASLAAKRIGIPYHKFRWIVTKGEINPIQRTPILLFEEKELDRYKDTLEK
jgi:hypothetical protein